MAGRNSRAEEVRDGLLEDLRNGTAPVGHKFPNEQELAERFQVSRPTVREAVGTLVQGGYLVRRHGSGTYVTALPGRSHALDATLSYTQMIREAGMQPGQRVLSVESRLANPEEREALDLSPSASLRVIERLRTADGRPVIYSVDRLPNSLLGGLSDNELSTPMYELLERIGQKVRSASAVLTPVIADQHLADVLGVRVASALQNIEEIDFSDLGTHVMLSSEWHVPGVFELRVNRRS